jgi:arabinogalactan oligomer / maltooligosaccharide transport system substrate-binding protein
VRVIRSVFAVGAVATFLLSACGSDNGGGGAATEAPGTTAASAATSAAATTEGGATTAPASTVPTAPGDADLVIWTDETRAGIIEPIANSCAAMQGAKVAVQQIAYGDLDDAVLQTAPRGTGPDIFTYAHDSLGNFVESGIVAPFDLSQIKDQYQDVAVEAFTYKGQTYGLPYAVENIALFRNTDLVPTAPATFEDLETTALQLKSEGKVEVPLAVQEAPTADPYHNYPMYSGGGGYVFGKSPDGALNPQDVGLDSPGGLAAGELWEKWTKEGLVSGSVSQDIMKDKFKSGAAPFAITGPWNLNDFKDAGVKFAVEPVPPINGTVTRPFVGVQGFLISAFAKNKDLATSFLTECINNKEASLKFFEGQPRPPARKDAYEAVQSDPYIQGFGAAAIQGEAQPNIKEMGAVWEAWTKAYQTIFNGGDGTKAFQDAAAEIRAKIASGS